MKKIKIFSPATVSNVACGFDVMGFALEQPFEELEISMNQSKSITIVDETKYNLPLELLKNTAGIAVSKLLEFLNSEQGFEIKFISKIKPGSGIGSSAASSVGALWGVNVLLGNPFSRMELVRFAMEGEKVASGSAHADNVAPAMLGGFVLIRSYNPLDIIDIPFPDDIYCLVVHPQIEIRTEDARKILKEQITLKQGIEQWANTAGLIAGLMKNDKSLISRSLKDVVVEPVRSILIPGYNQIKQISLENGAIGCCISGSGPSIFSLCEHEIQANKIGNLQTKKFNEIGINCHFYISKINKQGVKHELL